MGSSKQVHLALTETTLYNATMEIEGIGYWVLWHSLLKVEDILRFPRGIIIITGQQVFVKTEFHF